MTLQPQIDVDFINEMLFSHGKKVLDPFRLNRLDKAIKAMEKVDPIQAAAARSDYLTHINDNYLALEYLKRAISKYGYQIPFAICQIRIAYRIGDWTLIKNAWNYLFDHADLEKLEAHNVQGFINDCYWYADFDFPIVEEIAAFDSEGIDFFKNEVITIQNKLESLGISIETYRRVIGIIKNVMYQDYHLHTEHMVKFDDVVRIFIKYEGWSDIDILALNEKVNEAILAVDDIDFQVEADDIEVLFINFFFNEYSKEFSIYGEDDSDLTELVQKRMRENDEGLIKIEVADV